MTAYRYLILHDQFRAFKYVFDWLILDSLFKMIFSIQSLEPFNAVFKLKLHLGVDEIDV